MTTPGTVTPADVPGLWWAVLPTGKPLRVPDPDRPGRTAVALYRSRYDAARALAERGLGPVSIPTVNLHQP